jgi:hypothetical protein
MRLIAWVLLVVCLISVSYAAPPKPGAAPSVTVATAQNSAIVIYERHPQSGDVLLGAQKLPANGKLLQAVGEGCVEVAPEDGYLERAAAAVRDGAGGVIIVFEARGSHRRLGG